MTPQMLLHSRLQATRCNREEDGVVDRRASNAADDDRDLGGARDGADDRYCAHAGHERGTHRVSDGWHRAESQGRTQAPRHLPAHLQIVPKEASVAAPVDLVERRGAALRPFTVRYRSERLGTHLRGQHRFAAESHTHAVQDSWAMAMVCEALGKPCTQGDTGMGVRRAGVGAHPPTRSQRLGPPTAAEAMGKDVARSAGRFYSYRERS